MDQRLSRSLHRTGTTLPTGIATSAKTDRGKHRDVCLHPGEEPTYARIYRGQWLDDTLPYATIHRLASTEGSHGVAAACIDWCCRRMPNLRTDTHRDNHILQHILQNTGSAIAASST